MRTLTKYISINLLFMYNQSWEQLVFVLNNWEKE